MNRTFYQWALVSICSVLTACSSNKSADPVVYLEKEPVSAQWMSQKEELLRESIKGSAFTLHQQEGAWVVTAPAQTSFNPDRPALLLPAMLRPITRIAKMLEANPDAAVLVLGHTDSADGNKINHQLSADRARSVASIFRLSGLKGGRMMHLGMGSSHMLDKPKSSAQNHRVEIIITPHVKMQDMMAIYHPAYVRQLALSQSK
ncbi:MAG TPA: OmpA family protein [Thiopseudomonas sp.]|nr:OmpA family protein [Thiopseudomonas sp.]